MSVENIKLSDYLRKNYGDGHGSKAKTLGDLLDRETLEKIEDYIQDEIWDRTVGNE